MIENEKNHLQCSDCWALQTKVWSVTSHSRSQEKKVSQKRQVFLVCDVAIFNYESRESFVVYI